MSRSHRLPLKMGQCTSKDSEEKSDISNASSSSKSNHSNKEEEDVDDVDDDEEPVVEDGRIRSSAKMTPAAEVKGIKPVEKNRKETGFLQVRSDQLVRDE